MNIDQLFNQEIIEAAKQIIESGMITIDHDDQNKIYGSIEVEGEVFQATVDKRIVESRSYINKNDEDALITASFYMQYLKENQKKMLKEVVDELDEETMRALLYRILDDHHELISEYLSQEEIEDEALEGYMEEIDHKINEEKDLDSAYNDIALVVGDLEDYEDEDIIAYYLQECMDYLMDIYHTREDLQESIDEFVEEYKEIIEQYTDFLEDVYED